MTLTQKRKQLLALFGAYSIQLEKLYDKFLYRLAKLAKSSGVSVEDLLKKDALYSFDNYPELREQLQEIMRNFFKEGILAVRTGIASGVALSFSHNNADLKAYSVLSNMALNQVRDNAATAFYERRMKPEQGLSLSSTVWNYVRQAKSEVEAGISCVMTDGLMKGTSAEELARKVKVYLNEPDMMWRRYHEKVFVNGQKKDVAYWRKKVVDENGKVHFIKTEPYHPGQGVYRSSRKNALRLTRTEINGSYHYANHQRWKQEPFVIGIRIWMSPQHPEEDICDELAGDYPKDFFFSGWHPQCMCAAMPLTLQGKEKEDFYKRLAKGEDMSNYVSPNAIKDVPQAYKDYVKRDRDKIISAAERGKMAWHLYDNQKYWVGEFTDEELKEMGLEPVKPATPKKRIKTEEEKADIQKRWDERRAKYRKIIQNGKITYLYADEFDYKDIKGIKNMLREALLTTNLKDISNLSKLLEKSIESINMDAEQMGEYIPNVKEHLKHLYVSELQPVYNSIVSKVKIIESKSNGDLLQQQKFYTWEAEDHWGKGLALKYPETWEISKEAYYALAEKAKTQYEWQQVQNAYNELKSFNTKSPTFLGLLYDLELQLSLKDDLPLAQQLVTEAKQKKETLEKQALYRKKRKNATQASTPGSFSPYDLEIMTDEDALQLIDKFMREESYEMDTKLRKQTAEIWKILSQEERRVLTKYTQTYSYLNEPLRGINYRGDRMQEEFKEDMPLLTGALDKMRAKENMVVRRGVDDFNISSIGKYLSDLEAGDEFVDGGFLSTAVHKDMGFTEPYNLVIAIPKNSAGIYAEPFSHFTDSLKFTYKNDNSLWDGVSEESKGSEFEWIGQRGGKFRVIRRIGRTIYLQLIGQLFDVTSDYDLFFR